MYQGLSIIAIAPVFDEAAKIGNVIKRVPRDVVDETLIVDDGSTDDSVRVARDLGASVLSLGRTEGVGAALRAGFRYALEKQHDVVVVMAGNNKDAPEEIPRLVAPIANDTADFVQGSRFLDGRRDFGPMPLYRRIATRVHARLFSVAAGRRVTESTNGFRAIRSSILTDPRIDLSDPRLDGYELEPYLYLRVIKSGYRTTEVPVTKTYPPKALGQTKMKPFVDWWAILRPMVWAMRRSPRPVASRGKR